MKLMDLLQIIIQVCIIGFLIWVFRVFKHRILLIFDKKYKDEHILNVTLSSKALELINLIENVKTEEELKDIICNDVRFVNQISGNCQENLITLIFNVFIYDYLNRLNDAFSSAQKRIPHSDLLMFYKRAVELVIDNKDKIKTDHKTFLELEKSTKGYFSELIETINY